MQVPRDLSRRMLEAAEELPVVDIYERFLPERTRVNQRLDFAAWLLAYAGTELRALGVEDRDLALLGDVQASPERRWPVVSKYWPSIRTTATGRIVLRAVWELFGVEAIGERTWKDISAQMWQVSQPGFYEKLLHGKAQIRMVLVDNAVDPETRSCCAPVQAYDTYVAPSCRPDIEKLFERANAGPNATPALVGSAIGASIQQDLKGGCVAFKLGPLPDSEVPSAEEVDWSLSRVLYREEPGGGPEVPLYSYLVERFVDHVERTTRPVQVVVDSEVAAGRLEALAARHPAARFVALCMAGADALSLMRLARARANVALGMADLWQVAPSAARQGLRSWLYGVPLSKLFALAGGTTMVEGACAQAMIVREQIAALLADMVAAGELDERDANLAIERLLHQNAREYFGLEALTKGE